MSNRESVASHSYETYKMNKNRSMEKIIKLQITVLLCFFGTNVMADGRFYQIELIIFAQNAPNNERFDQTGHEIRWPGNLRDVSGFKQGSKQLGGTYGALKRSRDYRPFLHLSWVQKVGKNSLGQAVQIQKGGGQTGDDLLQGFVRIQRGTYLHLLVDLEYTPGSVVYRLKEKRRLKFNEIHYLDHPKFGVIAKVSPL